MPNLLTSKKPSKFLLATAMHEAGKFELLNVAGGFPAKRTLLVTAISRCQKDNPPPKPRHQTAHDGAAEADQIVVQPATGAGRGKGGNMNQMCICYVAFFAL
jgi:hypothetical protein